MNLGVVVDGKAEFASLPSILVRIAESSGHTYMRVLKADIQPKSPAGAIALVCRDAVLQLQKRGAHHVIVLFDLEDRMQCAPEVASDVASRLAELRVDHVSVVVKDRMFENWLIADLDSLTQQRGRFAVSVGMRRQVEPGVADHAPAADLIRRAIKGDYYDKVEDAKRILARSDPERMAQNSRSFRKFMRELRHPLYADQSRVPVG